MDVQILFPFIAALASLSIAIITYFKKRDDATTKAFAVLSLMITFWSIAVTLFYALSESYALTLAAKGVYLAGSFIAVAFFYFSLTFTDRIPTFRRYILYAILLLELVVFTLFIFTDSILGGYIISDGGVRGFVYGAWRGIFEVHFTVFFLSGFAVLYDAYRNADQEIRRRLQYIFLGSVVGVVFAGATNIVLPWFENFSFVWLGPFLVIAWPLSVAYGIFKHNLFNVRIITTESLVFVLWILLLARAILSETTSELVINLSTLLAAFILGFFLVQSVNKEVHSRLRAERLAKELAEANKRLRALDQQKSEFVSIASHQLRSPLTAIRGYASMVLEGSFGTMPKKMEAPMSKIMQSSRKLVNVVEDLLNIARIEQGRIKYNLEKLDVKKLVRGIVEELRANIEEGKSLDIVVKSKQGEGYFAKADESKLRQVFVNLIDNAILYTPMGEIEIQLRKTEDDKIRIAIQDTGIGIPREDMDDIFVKFDRGSNAAKLHANGSGIGLYLAKEIVEAHKGKVWAESEGEGEGSTFFVELPAAA